MDWCHENHRFLKIILAIWCFTELLFLHGCTKEYAIQGKENEVKTEISKIVPNELLDQIAIQLEERKKQPGYSIYLDSLNSVTSRLVDLLAKYNQLDSFKFQLDKIQNAMSNLKTLSPSNIECKMKKLGMGYGFGVDAQFIQNNGIHISGLGKTTRDLIVTDLQRWGGLKYVFDFCNLERRLFFFSACSLGDGAELVDLNLAMSTGIGFGGFYEVIMGFPFRDHGIDEYAGPSLYRKFTVSEEITLFCGESLGVSGGPWNCIEGICNMGDNYLEECPDYSTSQYSTIHGFTINSDASIRGGFAYALAVKESKIGVCSEAINGTYTNYNQNGKNDRLLRATNLTLELAGLTFLIPCMMPFNALSAALSYYYGTFNPSACLNSPPNQPTNPSPKNYANEQNQSLTLSWSCSDPDGDPLTYDVYIGPNDHLVYKSTVDQPFLIVLDLDGVTNYHWQVRARDDKNEIAAGPIWTFRTGGELNLPPIIPYNPSPADKSEDVIKNTTLIWEGYDPEDDPLSYDLFFDTNPNPKLVGTDITEIPFALGYLEPETKYYWKITAKDDHNHSTVGPIWSFTTGSRTGDDTGTIVDSRDGHVYKYVTIGTQIWMAENLAYLPSASPSSSGSDTSPFYYVYGYEGTSVSEAKGKPNYTTYGVLYNWEAAKTACPSGWHLPSDEEWKILEKNLGMSESDANTNDLRNSGMVGSKLKESGTMHWISPNTGATNTSYFTALPGGTQISVGGFYYLGYGAYFWSSSEGGSSNAWYRYLFYAIDGVFRNNSSRRYGFSVRCLKDQ
jgi:uncharacterized protein (TIGR02145 family)